MMGGFTEDSIIENRTVEKFEITLLTQLSLASFLWDIGKQYSHRCDASQWGIPSMAILLDKRIFIKNLYEN